MKITEKMKKREVYLHAVKAGITSMRHTQDPINGWRKDLKKRMGAFSMDAHVGMLDVVTGIDHKRISIRAEARLMDRQCDGAFYDTCAFIPVGVHTPFVNVEPRFTSKVDMKPLEHTTIGLLSVFSTALDTGPETIRDIGGAAARAELAHPITDFFDPIIPDFHQLLSQGATAAIEELFRETPD